MLYAIAMGWIITLHYTITMTNRVSRFLHRNDECTRGVLVSLILYKTVHAQYFFLLMVHVQCTALH